MKPAVPLLAVLLHLGCQPPVVKPGFDFRQIQTVSIAPIPDFESFPGSGQIIQRSLVYNLMKGGVTVLEREQVELLAREVAITQSALGGAEYDINLTPPDAILICTINEFTNSHSVVIPVVTEDKGRTVTTVRESREVPVRDDQPDQPPEQLLESTTTETIRYEGSVTKTQEIHYTNSRVGLSAQLVHKTTGEILWSNTYWYNGLSLTYTVDRCLVGLLKPLHKLR